MSFPGFQDNWCSDVVAILPSKDIINRQNATIVVGALFCLAGVFLTLAAHRVLPPGINVISDLGIWGQVAGYGGLVVGFIIWAVKWYLNKQNTSVDNGEPDVSGTLYNVEVGAADLECPEDYKPYFDRVPKKLVQKLLYPHHTPIELQVFCESAKAIYTSANREIMGPCHWSTNTQSSTYLESLSTTQPLFFAGSDLILNERNSVDDLIQFVSGTLPDSLGDAIISHELNIGNHATIFIIDLKNQTVEYFNSFGNDGEAMPFLINLQEHLLKKYETSFRYIHQTKDVKLQNDPYQCGFWICKFVQERIRMLCPEHFNARNYLDFDIGAYREEVLATAFEYDWKRSLNKA